MACSHSPDGDMGGNREGKDSGRKKKVRNAQAQTVRLREESIARTLRTARGNFIVGHSARNEQLIVEHYGQLRGRLRQEQRL